MSPRGWVCSREKMILTTEVAAVSLLIAMLNAISAMPLPGVIRERHIIHTPIKFKYIHHYNIKKVPIVIKKHLHYHKPHEEASHLADDHPNQIHDNEELHHRFESPQPPRYKIIEQSHRGAHEEEEEEEEEEYDEPEQSQEEQEYEDYEYE